MLKTIATGQTFKMYYQNIPIAVAISIMAISFVTNPLVSAQYIPQQPQQRPLYPHNQQPATFQQQQIHHTTSAQTNPYLRATDEILLNMRSQMVSRSIKFDDHFKSLLTASKVSLHNMFTDAYGMMYQTNVDIFTSMYEELEQYYAYGQIRLTQSMNRFFETLYQKIFTVFNTNRSFSPSSLKCATEQLAHLKPFKDVPEKLTDGVRHAFVAARTFVQALNNGIDVIKSIISIGQTAQCTHLINEKLLRNAHNGNNINIPPGSLARQPCLGYCEQVITRCFVKEPLALLNQKWSAYVSALSELGTKLSTNYNIETIIAPLDVQISEAIMLFQENATNISEHVFQACGLKTNLREDPHNLSPLRQPSNRLGKRAANPGPAPAPVATRFNHNSHIGSYNHKTPDDFTLGGHLKETARDLTSPGMPVPHIPATYLTPLGQKSPMLIEEIKNYMLSTRNFWANLPNEVCTSNYTLGPNATSVHNRKQVNCFQDKFEGFDINKDIRYKTEFDKQLVHLDDTRAKIESALAGREIIWTSDIHGQSTINQGISGIIGSRPAPYMTTSTSTTPEPNSPDQEEGEDSLCEGEEGSGDDCITEEEADVTTENPEYGTEESEIPDEDQTQSPQFPEMDQIRPTTEFSNNEIDAPPQQPHINESQSSLVTVGNLAGNLKSSQISNKLVISTEAHLLLALLMSSVLLIVNNFQIDHQLIS